MYIISLLIELCIISLSRGSTSVLTIRSSDLLLRMLVHAKLDISGWTLLKFAGLLGQWQVEPKQLNKRPS